MEIEITDDFIVIKSHSNYLKARHISQISFWGFKYYKEEGSYKKPIKDNEAFVLKLRNYLFKENIFLNPSQAFIDICSSTENAILKFEELRLLGTSIKKDAFDKDTFNFFSTFLFKNIHRKLKTHQIKAAYHLYSLGNSANFSVPGSGKTTVILSVFEKLRLEGKINKIFVVGPPACFGPWQNEFEATLNRKPRIAILAGGEPTRRKSAYYNFSDNGPELYLTSFHSLQNDKAEAKLFLNHKKTNVFFVIDEAHYMKQVNGLWANTILSLAEMAEYRCALTGTPMPSKYTDLFNIFEFLWPNSSPLDEGIKIKMEQYNRDKSDPSGLRPIVKNKVNPFFYRVKKSDLGLIPAKFHPPYVISMNKYEKIIYDAVQRKIKDFAQEDYMKNIDLVESLWKGRIIRLRQCVSYTKLISSSIENYKEEFFKEDNYLAGIICDYDSLEKPAKLDHLKLLVEKFSKNGQKVVIWANFIGTIELIANEIRKMGLECEFIYGKTPTIETSKNEEMTRDAIRDKFVDIDSGLNILIANPAACSESISLHKTCFHAVYYDLSFNCAQYLQSLDRIHRVGGSEINQANYYFLQYENTIDQEIMKNLKVKADEMYCVIEDGFIPHSIDMSVDDPVEPHKNDYS